MKILALDTTADGCSVALNLDGQILSRYRLEPRGHTRLIMPMLQELLAEAALRPADLDAIAFACGPGSFTGLRIATGVAQGLAWGTERPVVPISSLAAVALQAWRLYGWHQVAACFDARMGEVYWGCYSVAGDGASAVLNGCEQVLPASHAGLPAAGDWFGAGDGWKLQADFSLSVQQTVQTVDASLVPMAEDVARLAGPRWRAGGGVPAAEVAPVYLRDEVAWKKMPGR